MQKPAWSHQSGVLQAALFYCFSSPATCPTHLVSCPNTNFYYNLEMIFKFFGPQFLHLQNEGVPHYLQSLFQFVVILSGYLTKMIKLFPQISFLSLRYLWILFHVLPQVFFFFLIHSIFIGCSSLYKQTKLLDSRESQDDVGVLPNFSELWLVFWREVSAYVHAGILS